MCLKIPDISPSVSLIKKSTLLVSTQRMSAIAAEYYHRNHSNWNEDRNINSWYLNYIKHKTRVQHILCIDTDSRWSRRRGRRAKNLISIQQYAHTRRTGAKNYYGQLDISAALPVRTYRTGHPSMDYIRTLLRSEQPVLLWTSRRGRRVIEFPTANLICTEMKLYGICLERSINCFLCFLGSHKYSSFGG